MPDHAHEEGDEDDGQHHPQTDVGVQQQLGLAHPGGGGAATGPGRPTGPPRLRFRFRALPFRRRKDVTARRWREARARAAASSPQRAAAPAATPAPAAAPPPPGAPGEGPSARGARPVPTRAHSPRRRLSEAGVVRDGVSEPRLCGRLLGRAENRLYSWAAC